MKKLLLLTTAAMVMIAISEPGFAASRDKNARATSPTVQYLDAAGRARTYGEPSDAYASGGTERQYQQGYSYRMQDAPYDNHDYGGPNGW